MVQQVHCNRRRLLGRGLKFHACTINKIAHTKKVWKLISWSSYIRYIWFGLVWFYGISTIVGYLMPNPFYTYIVKLATVVKGDQTAPYSIATTPRCRGGFCSFPWIAPLYPWYVPYIAECLARRYLVPFLKSLVWRILGLNPGLPDHWRTVYPLNIYL